MGEAGAEVQWRQPSVSKSIAARFRVDLDYQTTWESDVRKRLNAFPFVPTMAIESGGGLHLYWLLTQPRDAQDSRLEPVLRGLAAHFGGDRAAAEIAHVMRLPGTLNHKYDPPRPCQVEEPDSERRYPLADFDKYTDCPCLRRKQLPTLKEKSGTDAIGTYCASPEACAATAQAQTPSKGHCSPRMRRHSANRQSKKRKCDASHGTSARKRPAQATHLGPGGDPLQVVDIHSFLAMDIPPRETMLEPWLPCQGLAMLYGRRGMGKTYLALGIGYAVGSGGGVLGWQAPKARKVLYIDGEMLAVPLQERLAAIAKGATASQNQGCSTSSRRATRPCYSGATRQP